MTNPKGKGKGKGKGRGQKKGQRTELAVGPRTDYQGAPAQVRRQSDGLLVSVDWEALPRPEYTMPVNCAGAYLRDGYPELRLGQLHAIRERELTRVLVVRYEPQRFVERAESNETFRQGLEDFLDEREKRGERGYFTKVLEGAGASDCDSATIDAEVEWAFRSGDFSTLVFVSTYGRDLHRVVVGKSDQLPVQPVVEATMPLRVMADLLLSWQELALETEL